MVSWGLRERERGGAAGRKARGVRLPEVFVGLETSGSSLLQGVANFRQEVETAEQVASVFPSEHLLVPDLALKLVGELLGFRG